MAIAGGGVLMLSLRMNMDRLQLNNPVGYWPILKRLQMSLAYLAKG